MEDNERQIKERDEADQARLAEIQEQKVKKHEETLKRIKDQSITRKMKIETENKSFKEVSNRKPLYQLYEEKYQMEFVAKDLEEKKKALQSKRSFQN